jgi:hypothetical protein
MPSIRGNRSVAIDDVVERAVQMLHEEEALLANDRDVIHERIERAVAQSERDGFSIVTVTRSLP